VVVGGLYALLNASTIEQQAFGFFAVLLGAGNAAGGYAVTDRMLAMFQTSGKKRGGKASGGKGAAHKNSAKAPAKKSVIKAVPAAKH
jgi:NAD(P) transhydrogenase subunit alpha